MPINPSKRGGGALRIESQDSFLDGTLTFYSGLKKHKFESINFYRKDTNHAYLLEREIIYEGTCENNLIISSAKNNFLKDVKNSFVFSDDQSIEVFSISDFDKIKGIGSKILSGKIEYNIPFKVKQRESVFNYDLEKIKDLLKNRWDLKVNSIVPIKFGRVEGGKYLIEDSKRKKYVFKFKGNDRSKIERSSEIISKLNLYFPEIYQRKDEDSYNFELTDGVYGLEKFIIGSEAIRDLNYFKKLGKAVALFHNESDLFLNPTLDLIQKEEDFTESNLLSIYFDLSSEFPNSRILVSFLEKILDENLSYRIRKIPKKLIHGDLNFSNVLNQNESLVFIDLESFGSDFRLKEFISPLILEGNMRHPKYVKGSMPIFLEQYNKHSKTLLSEEEISILPFLLQTSILKYYVIRRIRRRNKTENSFREVIGNLEKIKEDSNVH